MNAKGNKHLLNYCDSHYKSTVSSKSKARTITKRRYTTKRPRNHSIQSNQMKHTRLNQQTNDQNIPNNQILQPKHESQPINHSNRTNQLRNQRHASHPTTWSKPTGQMPSLGERHYIGMDGVLSSCPEWWLSAEQFMLHFVPQPERPVAWLRYAKAKGESVMHWLRTDINWIKLSSKFVGLLWF